ncbi:MAG: protein-methionine-sulfoxide reductase heme-binding subunit MsrQ [Gemmatimonadota bacterium]|nr:MAG: protein-methionine-sulfoxide reductase heme-binding subunit MsrQ [Gemmatimonadota bacterium]
MTRKRQVLLLKLATWVLALSPLSWLVWLTFTRRLGVDGVDTLLRRMGDFTLIILLITLAITPLRRLTGWNMLVRIRRLVGLFAFSYLTLHFLVYLVLDQTLDWEFILEDLTKRPYAVVGFAAWLLLIPLAFTSTRGWVRRLGKRWQTLHKLVYVAVVLGLLHFYWQVKADTLWPLVAATVYVVLLSLRVRSRTATNRLQGEH